MVVKGRRRVEPIRWRDSIVFMPSRKRHDVTSSLPFLGELCYVVGHCFVAPPSAKPAVRDETTRNILSRGRNLHRTVLPGLFPAQSTNPSFHRPNEVRLTASPPVDDF